MGPRMNRRHTEELDTLPQGSGLEILFANVRSQPQHQCCVLTHTHTHTHQYTHLLCVHRASIRADIVIPPEIRRLLTCHTDKRSKILGLCNRLRVPEFELGPHTTRCIITVQVDYTSVTSSAASLPSIVAASLYPPESKRL